MPKREPSSPWRIRLVREIAVILLIKLTLLLSIKAIWFNEPTVPEDGQQRVEHHLFGQPAPLSIHTEETPR
ncbi:cytochrome oxidase putative small subunit CydP [Ectopseudomonas oleovorans]|uniref:cytochrome oxidase putative small subunit CydP n=1 Tax=Ectopseudomonas oleovorans TaxID=301 RepID=UPI0035B16D66